MKPVFSVARKSDGLTDFIYSFDFKAGEFVGDVDIYSYDDVDYFIGLPAEIVRLLFEDKHKAKKEAEPVAVD